MDHATTYFQNYTVPGCRIECETEKIYAKCNCKLVESPGNYPICTPTQYKCAEEMLSTCYWILTSCLSASCNFYKLRITPWCPFPSLPYNMYSCHITSLRYYVAKDLQFEFYDQKLLANTTVSSWPNHRHGGGVTLGPLCSTHNYLTSHHLFQTRRKVWSDSWLYTRLFLLPACSISLNDISFWNMCLALLLAC